MNKKRRKRKSTLAAFDPRVKLAGMIVAAVLVLIIALNVINKYSIEFNIAENDHVTVEFGEKEIEEVTALYKGTIFKRKGIPVEVTSEGKVNLEKLGTYKITYSASYKKVSASASRTVDVVDTTKPVITLVSDPEHFTSPIAKYEEEGYTATDIHDGDLTEDVVAEEKDGFVYYIVTDSSGNTATAKREIIYKDVVPPEIELTDGEEINWEAGEKFKDPGFVATDDCDGDITANVETKGKVKYKKPGTYELTYSVKDAYDNVCEVTRKVTVADTKAPELTLDGDTEVYVQVGNSYDEAGYSATDSFDGDLTDSVTVSGLPDTDSKGVYTVTYTAKDAAGNEVSKERTVYVYATQSSASTVDPGDKVVYLTFDDGPGPYTQELLDILDKYGVKVTFFVTNQYPAYQNLIGEEYRRGHTVAIHTYTHDYSSIYQSEAAFFADLQKMSDICEAQTGVAPKIIRFPGGSSNTISKSYCEGIMSALAVSVEKMGYKYCDWNITSGDAGETTDTEVVYQTVISNIPYYNVSNVLQHDVKGFSVAAVEKIIQWGLANGYTFLPLDETSPMSHHGINN